MVATTPEYVWENEYSLRDLVGQLDIVCWALDRIQDRTPMFPIRDDTEELLGAISHLLSGVKDSVLEDIRCDRDDDAMEADDDRSLRSMATREMALGDFLWLLDTMCWAVDEMIEHMPGDISSANTHFIHTARSLLAIVRKHLVGDEPEISVPLVARSVIGRVVQTMETSSWPSMPALDLTDMVERLRDGREIDLPPVSRDHHEDDRNTSDLYAFARVLIEYFIQQDQSIETYRHISSELERFTWGIFCLSLPVCGAVYDPYLCDTDGEVDMTDTQIYSIDRIVRPGIEIHGEISVRPIVHVTV